MSLTYQNVYINIIIIIYIYMYIYIYIYIFFWILQLEEHMDPKRYVERINW